jgi:8-amino-7-oxononanoate synthase
MKNSPYDWLNKSLETIHKANWYRREKTVTNLPGSILQLEGKTVINFASNDYLGLASDARLIKSAIAATQEFGTGSTGSRLLSGHRSLHRQLEQAIASLKQTEDALVFSSGYLANIGTIAAIMGQKDLILGDKYNHSSLKNGAKLSGATVIEYLHCNLEDLENKLEQHRHQYRHCLISTDSVFSMDGDICQVPDLLSLGEKYNCMVLVDEAHGTGVMGKTGAGCVEHFGCTGREMIQIGTLSKALGSLGGYVAGSATLIDFLKNRAPSWVYTTALSPADTAAALTAIKIVKQESERRQKLWHNVNFLKQELAKLKNITTLPSDSPIICLSLESAQKALIAAEKFKNAGIFAPAIRPPTVPTSRIRLSLMATHTTAQIEQLLILIRTM